MHYLVIGIVAVLVIYFVFSNQKPSTIESSVKKNSSQNSELSSVNNENTDDYNELVPIFIPALSAVLTAAEEEKGSPLTEKEVLNIRDNSVTIMSPISVIDKLIETRGYEDVDPENVWNDWLLLRDQMGKEVNSDGGAIVLDIKSNDPDMRKAELHARKTLNQFKEHIIIFKKFNPMIKVRIEEEDASARMWLAVDEVNSTSFDAHLFEVPSDFIEYDAGDSFEIENEDILDWMINVDGSVYGAFTIREQRKSMTKKDAAEMDDYMGVSEYK